MNLQKLFEMQRRLDEHIEKKHPRQEGEDRLAKKILALLVEIGELSNETRCFKYWSNKGPSDKNVILEEAADVLHFLLSLGNDIGIDDYVPILPPKTSSLELQFIELFEYARNAHKGTMWTFTFDTFVGLIEMLGFSWRMLEKAYMKKYEENIARQERGY
ncbi:dUTP diphosphatase [Geobacillus phage vB_GthS_NIIg9.7]|nr:dUTP diphosphatase [Geobacillus phage vB_GthS_NIIg9.7]